MFVFGSRCVVLYVSLVWSRVVVVAILNQTCYLSAVRGQRVIIWENVPFIKVGRTPLVGFNELMESSS